MQAVNCQATVFPSPIFEQLRARRHRAGSPMNLLWNHSTFATSAMMLVDQAARYLPVTRTCAQPAIGSRLETGLFGIAINAF
jgi:hypothetical protein